MVVLTFLVGTFFYVMSRILELKNTTLHATLVVFNTVKKTQYVVIFDRKSPHTVFFRKHDIIFVRQMWYIIVPTGLTYTHVPENRQILHRLYSHNNVPVPVPYSTYRNLIFHDFCSIIRCWQISTVRYRYGTGTFSCCK